MKPATQLRAFFIRWVICDVYYVALSGFLARCVYVCVRVGSWLGTSINGKVIRTRSSPLSSLTDLSAKRDTGWIWEWDEAEGGGLIWYFPKKAPLHVVRTHISFCPVPSVRGSTSGNTVGALSFSSSGWRSRIASIFPQGSGYLKGTDGERDESSRVRKSNLGGGGVTRAKESELCN